MPWARCRYRYTDPRPLPMVRDFLVSKKPQAAQDMPHYLRSALDRMPKAWTTDLDEIARSRTDDAAQATLALSLQAAIMAAQVAKECEAQPSIARHKAALAKARKENEALVARHQADLAALEAARKAREDLVERHKVIEQDMAEEVNRADAVARRAQEEVARMRLELDSVRAARDLAAGELQSARQEIAALDARRKDACEAAERLAAQLHEIESDPRKDAVKVGDVAYYLAYANSILKFIDGGLYASVELFKTYALGRRLDDAFAVDIRDLETVYGIDLSWYPQQNQIVDPGSSNGESSAGQKNEEPSQGPTGGEPTD